MKSLLFKILLFVRPSIVYQQIAQHMMSSLPFAQLLGIRIDAIGPGTAETSMPDDAKLHNHIGTQHAGALFTLAETASGAAMAGGFAELIMQLRPLAKQATIRYQKVAQGGTLARAKVEGDLAALKAQLHAERKLAFPVQVDIFDSAGVQVCQMQVDWHLSFKEPKA
ncbi:YiiD C-terminal domain-containing protein [Massilia sp. W12]|uniref:PaaI family thioesterase n=1 Tax=Massilia sp. W12 TaxID=3126507 RepID=UPI0030D1CC39